MHTSFLLYKQAVTRISVDIHSDIPSLLYSENKEKIPTQGAFLSGKPKANHCFYRFHTPLEIFPFKS